MQPVPIDELTLDAARGPSAPPHRRSEDDPTTIVLLGPSGLAAVASPAGITLLEGEAASTAATGLASSDRFRQYAFLVDLGGEEAMLLGAMGAYPIARGAGGAELLMRAAAAAGTWRRAEQRLAHRLALPDWLVAYADALSGAAAVADVHDALATYAHRIVGAYSALVLVQPEGKPAEVVARDGRVAVAGSLTAEELARLERPGILTSADVNARGLLGILWGGLHAVYVLHARLDAGSFVFLIERRRERVFTAEDSDLFQAVVRQARATLGRLVNAGPPRP